MGCRITAFLLSDRNLPDAVECWSPLFLLAGVGKDEPRIVGFCAACAPSLGVVLIDYGDWPEWIAPGFGLDAIVRRIIAAIESEAPDGPIFVGGYSLGAEIAYAVAMALTTAGRRIGFLGILDADISRGPPPPQPGALQRLLAAIGRGEATERIASYASGPLTSHLARASPFGFAASGCRAISASISIGISAATC